MALLSSLEKLRKLARTDPDEAPRLRDELGAMHAELVMARTAHEELKREIDAYERYIRMHADKNQWPTFADMSEEIEDALRPPLDRRSFDQELSPRQKFWAENGYLILEKFLPTDLIDRYVAVREKCPVPGGWACPTPYLHIPEIRDLALYPPLMAVMKELFGGEMILHLNLTGFVSTERDWHQDDYLNPPVINGWYAAVWMALDDIHPDCGPFQFVPGSHRWATLRQEKVRSFLPPIYARAEGGQFDFGTWTKWSEDFVAHAVAKKIEESKLPVKDFLGKKGDLLIWHACLAHRGSRPRVPLTPRRALISHYSEIEHRVDFPASHHRQHTGGGHYQHFEIPLY